MIDEMIGRGSSSIVEINTHTVAERIQIKGRVLFDSSAWTYTFKSQKSEWETGARFKLIYMRSAAGLKKVF